MRKHYILLTALASITPAHAALVVEPEPVPAYIPYTPVAPVAAPAPYPAGTPANSPTQGTAAQQFQPQPAVQQAGPASPTAPATTGGADQAKKLLAEDAAKVIKQEPAKTAGKPSDKQLGGQINPKVATEGEFYRLNTSETAPAQAEAKKDAKEMEKAVPVKEHAPEIKSDVVEVKPVAKAEPLPSWSATPGTTLRQTIQGWSTKEGWDVRWESELLDYPIEEQFSMVGKYLDVITRTFELYKDAKRPFKVEIYPTQKLVVVKEKK